MISALFRAKREIEALLVIVCVCFFNCSYHIDRLTIDPTSNLWSKTSVLTYAARVVDACLFGDVIRFESTRRPRSCLLHVNIDVALHALPKWRFYNHVFLLDSCDAIKIWCANEDVYMTSYDIAFMTSFMISRHCAICHNLSVMSPAKPEAESRF